MSRPAARAVPGRSAAKSPTTSAPVPSRPRRRRMPFRRAPRRSAGALRARCNTGLTTGCQPAALRNTPIARRNGAVSTAPPPGGPRRRPAPACVADDPALASWRFVDAVAVPRR